MFRVSLKKTLQLSLHFPVRASENKATGSRDVSKLIVPIARNYLTNRSSFPLRRNEETILGWIHEIPRIQITAEWTRLVHNVRKTTRRGGGNVREATNEKVSWKKSVRQFSLLSFFFSSLFTKSLCPCEKISWNIYSQKCAMMHQTLRNLETIFSNIMIARWIFFLFYIFECINITLQRC